MPAVIYLPEPKDVQGADAPKMGDRRPIARSKQAQVTSAGHREPAVATPRARYCHRSDTAPCRLQTRRPSLAGRPALRRASQASTNTVEQPWAPPYSRHFLCPHAGAMSAPARSDRFPAPGNDRRRQKSFQRKAPQSSQAARCSHGQLGRPIRSRAHLGDASGLASGADSQMRRQLLCEQRCRWRLRRYGR